MLTLSAPPMWKLRGALELSPADACRKLHPHRDQTVTELRTAFHHCVHSDVMRASALPMLNRQLIAHCQTCASFAEPAARCCVAVPGGCGSGASRWAARAALELDHGIAVVSSESYQ